MKSFSCFVAAAVGFAFALPARAQLARSGSPAITASSISSFVVPQARRFASAGRAEIQVSEVRVGVEIVEQVATTTMDITLANPSSSRLEAQLVVPVPDRAVLRGITFEGAASEPTAELLTREEARRAYDQIVARTKDPALLEFIGYNLIQSSLFPIEPRAGQKVRLTYEHLLPRDGDRVDFVLPRTESIEYRVPWKVSVKIKAKGPIGTVYSPSHNIETVTLDANTVTARLSASAETEPGPFRVSYLLKSSDFAASLMAYPDAKIGGGYFLLLAGAPSRLTNQPAIKREVILVLDRSGSMAGEKLEQVRASVLQVLEGLEEGESFNILVYNENVEAFAPEPVLKSAQTMRAAREYLRTLLVRGGTNIHDALQEALRMKARDGFLGLVLFLTDGLPTIGQTSEKAIRELVAKGNPYGRRIFTFGVGVDVNTPLLDKIALDTRAAATFVLPKEDVELRVAQVFKRLSGPVVVEPQLRMQDNDEIPPRIRALMPNRLPDLFEGDQIVVLGQYVGDKPLHFQLRGNSGGQERTFQFQFELTNATTRNAFVPRLWASRRIALLTDAIRDLGLEQGGNVLSTPSANDPRLRELVPEIVRLSKEFGILSEYTAFLAREGTDLSRPANVMAEALKNFDERAVKDRFGRAGVNQDVNNGLLREQKSLNYFNGYVDANLNRVEITRVQQVNDKAFYKESTRWVDSSLLDKTAASPQRVVEIGSPQFRDLVDRLVRDNRQGIVALSGEILLEIDGETVLVR